MANVISISVDSVTSDLTEFTLVDGTAYSSPSRNTLSIYATVQKINADATVKETLTITSDTDDPETATEFTVPYTNGDGWYRSCVVLAPDYNIGTTYAIYDLVDDGGSVFRSLQNSNTGNSTANTSFWEPITGDDIGLIALNEGETNESANIDSTVFEFIMSNNSEKAYASKIAEASEQYLTSTFIPDDLLDTYSLLGLLVNGQAVYSDRSQYAQGERVVQRLNSIIESL